MADNKVGRLGALIVIASLIFIEVIYVYNALSKPRLIIDSKVRILKQSLYIFKSSHPVKTR